VVIIFQVIIRKAVLFLSFFVTTLLLADVKDVDSLAEKVNQATSEKEKKVLIEKVKKELTIINKQARDEADALVKAKLKKPTKSFVNP